MADKEVYYVQYCPRCEKFHQDEEDWPCCDCLTTSKRTDSHKPLYFKENEHATTKNKNSVRA